MLVLLLCIYASLLLGTVGLNVTVTTSPEGPPFRAGTIFNVTCTANGNPPYEYKWSIGCSYTTILLDSARTKSSIGLYPTTPIICQDIYKCTVTDMEGTSEVGQITIKPVTDIAIQILVSETFHFVIRNTTILTVNESGRFLDIVCTTGLKYPNVGKWILPNGHVISHSNEKFEIEQNGGINSLAHITLKLKEGYSLKTEDMGLYTCAMPDINEEERVSHVWILPEQTFEPADEFFSSYSGKTVKLHCGFSTTPGEIQWFIKDTLLAGNDSFLITQRLLHSTPTVLYEGVLDIFDDRYMSHASLLRCVIFSQIIGNNLDSTPASKTIASIHYFVLSFIGRSTSITCSFTSEAVQNIEVHSDEGIINSRSGKNITFEFGKTTDVIHNKKYVCFGVTSDGNVFFRNFSIVALIPPHALAMDIKNTETVFAGEALILDITAEKTFGFTYEQSVYCTNQNEILLSELEGFDYPRPPTNTGLQLNLKIHVSPVTLSHAGLYICTAFLETPSLLDNISDTANTTIRVKIPSPSVILNTSEHVSVLHTGDLALYTCNAMITNTHIHLPVHAVFKWTLDNLSIHSRERFEVSELPPLTTTNITSYHSLLTVAPVIRSEDEGVLMCSVFITEDISNEYILDSSIASTSTKLRIEGRDQMSSEYFQFHLVGLEIPCLQWIVEPLNNTYLNIISSEIVEAITLRCECEYSINYIVNEHFQCSEEQSSTCVTYRARLYGTRDQETVVLVGYMQDWIDSGPNMIHINLSDSFLSIDTDCGVVNSYNDSLCVCMSGTNEIASSGLLLTTISLIIGITVGVLCFILIFGLVVISVYRYKKKNTKRQSPIHTANNPLAVLHHANTNPAYGRRLNGNENLNQGRRAGRNVEHDYDYPHIYY